MENLERKTYAYYSTKKEFLNSKKRIHLKNCEKVNYIFKKRRLKFYEHLYKIRKQQIKEINTQLFLKSRNKTKWL